MRTIYILLTTLFFSISISAQIDGNLLLGLVTGTTAEINAIANPVVGSLVYNSEEGKMYINTSTGFAKVPSIDANSIDFWNATGNANINTSIHFLGTTDTQDLIFKTNNIEAARILPNNQFLGIGTSTPSERLDINGTMRLRSIATTTSDLDILVTTATGVIQKRIFADFEGPTGPAGNNGSNGISITNATINGSDELVLTLSDTNTINAGVVVGATGPQGTNGTNVTSATINNNNELVLTLSDTSTINAGQVIDSKLNFGGRWTNTNTTTNLNIDNTLVPIFGSENYKDDGNNLYEVNGNALTVKEAGRYQIIVNLSLLGINNDNSRQRTNTNAQIAVNNVITGALAATGYIRFAGNDTNGFYNTSSSLHINEILQLSANDVITIISFAKGNSGPVNFSGANESSFIINKLK